ncbi:hypothetical protein Daus18300_004908 [Diaporthe australafricana]|uniref:2EXR domain-containing protein n=1 Tax=Diaporthe australafricana TaxID=127596 RepID=A0ABR3X5G7_9PEZI
MSDLDAAGYRLLSFKYTPTKPVTREKSVDLGRSFDHDLDKPRAWPLSTGEESELPSLSSLATALPVISSAALLSKPGDEARVPGKKPHPHAEREPETDTATATAPVMANFRLFGDLPAELRIKIWHLTFLPRVVELHPTRPNYAAVHDDGRQQQWQSGCSNPAALSVCSEARQIALDHFRIAYPLAAITTQYETPSPFAHYAARIGTYNFSGGSANGKASLRRRTLHISPEEDTVALLGQDSDFAKLSRLLESFRDADPRGLGMVNLALSTRGWGYGGSAAMMRSLNRTILKDLNQLTLFMYSEPLPPSEWCARGASLDEQSLERFRKIGNKCEIVPCESSNVWYAYKVWSGGKGRQFWGQDGKMIQVGKNEMRIMDLEFADGW